MSHAIQDTRSCINTNDQKDPTPSVSLTVNNKVSTRPSVLNTTNSNLYTTYYQYNNNVNRISNSFRYNEMKFYRCFYGDNGFQNNEVINNGDIYIAIDNPHGNNDGSKCYSVIRDRYDFLINYLNIPERSRNFYEVILGHQAQKPHFDLDVDLTTISTHGYSTEEIIQSTEDVKNCLLNCIGEVLLDYNIPYNPQINLLIFSSHGPNKRSYHIIIDGYCHSNNVEAKAFYDLVMERLRSKITYNSDIIVVDPKVYSNLQCFRMFGSTKLGKDRIKRFDKSSSRYRDPTVYTDLDNFYSYMVTAIQGCVYLPSFIKEEDKPQHQVRSINGHEIDEIIRIFNNYRFRLYRNRDDSTLLSLSDYYKYQDSSDSSVRYKRIKSGYCPCHTKDIKHDPHDSVGCYTTVSIGGYIKFYCYSGCCNPVIIGRLNTVIDLGSDNKISVTTIQSMWLKSKGININKGTLPKEEELLDDMFNAGDYILTLDQNGKTIIRTREISEAISNFQIVAGPIIDNTSQPRIQAHPIVNNNTTMLQSIVNNSITIGKNPTGFLPTLQPRVQAHPVVNNNTTMSQPIVNNTLQPRVQAYPIVNNNTTILHPIVNNNITTLQSNENIIPISIKATYRIGTDTDFINFCRSMGCTDPSQHTISECYSSYCTYCRNNKIIPQSLPAIIPDTIKVVTEPVKRSATIDDIVTFIDTLRVNDTNSKVACNDLYEPFRQYCVTNNLIYDNGIRSFTNIVIKSGKISTTIIKRKHFITGISIKLDKNVNISLLSEKVRNTPQIVSDSHISTHYNSGELIINDVSSPVDAINMNSQNEDNKLTGTPTVNNNNYKTSTVNNNNYKTSTNNNNYSICSIHICPFTTMNNNVNITVVCDGVISHHPSNTLEQQNINNVTEVANILPPIDRQEQRPSTIEDIDLFISNEFVIDANEKIPSDVLYEAFIRHCEANNLTPAIKCSKLFNLIADRHRISILFVDPMKYLQGYKLKHDPRAMDDASVSYGHLKIWNNWTDPYYIGWSNGPYGYKLEPEQYPEWKDIDVTYTSKLPLWPIEEMVENTNKVIEIPKKKEEPVIDLVRLQAVIDTSIYAQSLNLSTEAIRQLLIGILQDYDNNNNNVKASETNNVTQELGEDITLRIGNHLRSITDNEVTDIMINGALQYIAQSMNKEQLHLLSLSKYLDKKFCLGLKAPCGSGKTEGIKPYVVKLDKILEVVTRAKYLATQYYKQINGINDILEVEQNYAERIRILICVNRRTLTRKFYREYRELGFEIYTGKSKEIITGDRVIVCYPSLHRLIGEYDIAIFDEYCSTIKLQFQVVKKKRQCYKRFETLLKITPKVIIADAGLKNRHILDIKRISKRPLIVHQNICKNQRDKMVIPVLRKGLLILETMRALREGKRVAVPNSSKKYAYALKERVERLLPEINVGIFTADETILLEDDAVSYFSQYQLIIYTGTIQAGNSYTEMVDEVHGYFLKQTADYEDIMQMLFRCRNIGSGKIYLCIESKGFQTKIIPDDVSARFEDIHRYLLRRDILSRGHLESEQYKLPTELFKTTNLGEIDPNGKYFNLYVGYIKDLVQQQRSTVFLLMLSLRDQGVRFGGYIGRMKITPEVLEVEKEFMAVSKEINKVENAEIVKESDVTDEEAAILKNKDTTKRESRQLIKYELKKEYGTPIIGTNRVNIEITENLIKKTRGMHTKHNNLVKFARVAEITDDQERSIVMTEIGSNIINTSDNLGTIDRVHTMNKVHRVSMCYHAVNFLKILGLNNVNEWINSGEIKEFSIGMKSILEQYTETHNEALRYILNWTKEEITQKEALKIANAVLFKCFGIRVVIIMNDSQEITGFNTRSIWIHTNNVIVPKDTNIADNGLKLVIMRPLADNPTIKHFIHKHSH